MDLIKYCNNTDCSKEFVKKLQSKFKEKIIKFLTDNEDIFLIKENDLYLGFLHFNSFNCKISIKLFLNSIWKENLEVQLFRKISDLLKNKYYNYLLFSHCFDSENILSRIKSLDSMHQYECDENFNRLNFVISKNLTILTEITDYDKLIDFHYLCYSDDNDYMYSEWKKMLQTFPKAQIPKITYFCYNKDTIIGSIIGYIIPKKNKKYLYSICVHPDYRGKSIGGYLLQVFLQAEPLIPCYLTVYDTAKPAINLYKKFGFKMIKTVEAIVANEVYI